MDYWLILTLSIIGGIAVLFGMMFIASTLAQKIGLYFGAPIIMLVLIAALGSFVYFYAVKKQAIISVTWNGKEVEHVVAETQDDGNFFTPDFAYIHIQPGQELVNVNYEAQVEELAASQARQLCRDYELQPLPRDDRPVPPVIGMVTICINKHGLW